jgi:hypothetical protein
MATAPARAIEEVEDAGGQDEREKEELALGSEDRERAIERPKD